MNAITKVIVSFGAVSLLTLSVHASIASFDVAAGSSGVHQSESDSINLNALTAPVSFDVLGESKVLTLQTLSWTPSSTSAGTPFDFFSLSRNLNVTYLGQTDFGTPLQAFVYANLQELGGSGHTLTVLQTGPFYYNFADGVALSIMPLGNTWQWNGGVFTDSQGMSVDGQSLNLQARFTLVSVPEPSSAVCGGMVVALAMLCVYRKKLKSC